jgi:hypothetical protein
MPLSEDAKPKRQAYEPLGQDDGFSSAINPIPPSGLRRMSRDVIIALATFIAVCLGFSIAIGRRPGKWSPVESGCPCTTSNVPQYFQTSPELWAGPTVTGKAPFMAQTVTFDPTASYVPNAPLQTAIPIDGMSAQNESIFRMMGSVYSLLGTGMTLVSADTLPQLPLALLAVSGLRS